MMQLPANFFADYHFEKARLEALKQFTRACLTQCSPKMRDYWESQLRKVKHAQRILHENHSKQSKLEAY